MGPLPLIFGVTGHRDIRLADRDAIASLVGAVFDRYRARCPATPFILISGLAAGADRLVAQVACERGIAIHAALPLPLEEYEQDFSEPADLQEFRMLLDPRSHGCAERVYVVPAVAAEGTTAETAPARPHCYALLGAHIVRYCDVLIALWDGRQTGKEGGTADVVDKQLARTRNADQRPLLAHPDAGPTHHILTPRASLDGDTAIPLVGRELFPADHESADPAAYFEGIFADFEAFNRDAPLAADAPTQAAAILSTADAAGVRFRRQWFQRAEWVLGFAFVFALAFEVFVHARDFAQSQPGAVNLAIDWLWIVLLLLGLVSYATAYVRARPKKFRALQSKFLDYRGVAEGIRVQNYWHRAGLPDAAWQSYAPRQQSEIPWIRRAVRTAAYLELANAPRAQSESGDELAVLRTIRDQWIGSAGDASGQVGYFAARIASEGAALRKSSRWKRGLIAANFALLAVLFVYLLLIARNDANRQVPTAGSGPAASSQPLAHLQELLQRLTFPESRAIDEEILLLLIAVSAIWIARHAALEEIHGYEMETTRYRHMLRLFSDAGRKFDVTAASELAPEEKRQLLRQLFRELGEAALDENAEWILAHRRSRFDVPGAA